MSDRRRTYGILGGLDGMELILDVHINLSEDTTLYFSRPYDLEKENLWIVGDAYTYQDINSYYSMILINSIINKNTINITQSNNGNYISPSYAYKDVYSGGSIGSSSGVRNTDSTNGTVDYDTPIHINNITKDSVNLYGGESSNHYNKTWYNFSIYALPITQ